MKVLTAFFNAESNAFVKKECGLDDFVFKFGDEMLEEMKVTNLFRENNIELIPSIYANGYAQGLITKDAFQFISNYIIQAVKNNLTKIDGLYLFLHGASYVNELEGGSGEHYLLREIRKITGPYFPIAVVMDPHGNISKELAENCTIMRCYRESPHIDIDETYERVALMLIDHLKNRKNITPVFRRVPIMLGGERCVSTDEPLLSINKMMNEMEESEKILSISYYIGYVRHDNYTCGAAVVVIPSEEKYTDYAEKTAEKIAAYAYSKRKEFHFTGYALDPEEALDEAVKHNGRPVFITDSGDNTTAGASGQSTYIMRQLLSRNEFNNKRILISAITDMKAVNLLKNRNKGDLVQIPLGKSSSDPLNIIHIDGEIIAEGKVRNLKIFGGSDVNAGDCITVRLNNFPIDVVISDSFISYAEMHQFKAGNIDLHKYDIIVVKQGYIFPELKDFSDLSIMSLTPGETYQYTEKLPYKKILRPMYPIDNI